MNGVIPRISVLADSCCLSCVKADQVKILKKVARRDFFFTLLHLLFQ